METNLTETPNENLINEMFERWRDLYDLIDTLPKSSRRDAHNHADRIREINHELTQRRIADLMRQANVRQQFSQHVDRLDAFLVRLLLLCVEHDFAPARPIAESWSEYLEAWEQRSVPSAKSQRELLDRTIREKRQQRGH